MWDYHQGREGTEIVEREDGWIGLSYGPKEYFKEYWDWHPHEREAIGYARGRVLDLGCGAGRHAIYLQEKGLDVMGLDASLLAIRTARARGLKRARVHPVTRISSKLGCFDTILMMGNGFGLFANLKRARWLLRRLHGMTGDDARIIAESSDPYGTKNRCHLDYHRENRKRGKFSLQMTIRVRYEQYVGAWFEYLKVSRDEMEYILQSTGWCVSRFVPDTGDTYVGVMEKM